MMKTHDHAMETAHTREDLDAEIDKLGEHGFELVAVVYAESHEGSWTAFMKRPHHKTTAWNGPD